MNEYSGKIRVGNKNYFVSDKNEVFDETNKPVSPQLSKIVLSNLNSNKREGIFSSITPQIIKSISSPNTQTIINNSANNISKIASKQQKVNAQIDNLENFHNSNNLASEIAKLNTRIFELSKNTNNSINLQILEELKKINSNTKISSKEKKEDLNNKNPKYKDSFVDQISNSFSSSSLGRAIGAYGRISAPFYKGAIGATIGNALGQSGIGETIASSLGIDPTLAGAAIGVGSSLIPKIVKPAFKVAKYGYKNLIGAKGTLSAVALGGLGYELEGTQLGNYISNKTGLSPIASGAILGAAAPFAFKTAKLGFNVASKIAPYALKAAKGGAAIGVSAYAKAAPKLLDVSKAAISGISHSTGGIFKASSAIIEKSIAKYASKGILKTIAKKIPVIGALAGFGLAIGRILGGDYTGAAIEAGSGAASLAPGVGTATSFALDAANAARDIYQDVYGNYPEQDEASIRNERLKDITEHLQNKLKTYISSNSSDSSQTEKNITASNITDDGSYTFHDGSISLSSTNKIKASSSNSPLNYIKPLQEEKSNNSAQNITINKGGDTYNNVNSSSGGNDNSSGSPSIIASPFDFYVYGKTFEPQR